MVGRLVSIKVPVLHAFQDMGIDISKDIPVFTRWAVECERERIASYYSFKKKITVKKASHCSLELPCDAAVVKGIILGDHGCECSDLFSNCFSSLSLSGTASSDTFLIVDAFNTNTSILSPIKWEIQSGHIVFQRDYDGQQMTIQYLGFQEDNDGFPMVLSTHVSAITSYIMYKYCVRSKFSPNKMSDSDVLFHKNESEYLIRSARADDSELSESDRNEIIAMIHDPFIGYGMEVGMHNTNDNFMRR